MPKVSDKSEKEPERRSSWKSKKPLKLGVYVTESGGEISADNLNDESEGEFMEGVDSDHDSEAEVLERAIMAEKEKIIIKRRRLKKLQMETARMTKQEESEDELFSVDRRESQAST